MKQRNNNNNNLTFNWLANAIIKHLPFPSKIKTCSHKRVGRVLRFVWHILSYKSGQNIVKCYNSPLYPFVSINYECGLKLLIRMHNTTQIKSITELEGINKKQTSKQKESKLNFTEQKEGGGGGGEGFPDRWGGKGLSGAPGSWASQGCEQEVCPQTATRQTGRVWYRRPGSGISWIDWNKRERQQLLQLQLQPLCHARSIT